MRYTATVRLGTVPVTVAADSLHELLQELQHVRDLDAAREGVEDAAPMFREWDGYRYYGFRRGDGAELLFGQHKESEKRGRLLYAYAPTSEGYRGWQRYDHELGERVPAGAETRATPRAADVPAEAALLAREPGPMKGRATAEQRDRVRELIGWPCVTEDERARARAKLSERNLTAAAAEEMIAALEGRIRKRAPFRPDDLPALLDQGAGVRRG